MKTKCSKCGSNNIHQTDEDYKLRDWGYNVQCSDCQWAGKAWETIPKKDNRKK